MEGIIMSSEQFGGFPVSLVRAAFLSSTESPLVLFSAAVKWVHRVGAEARLCCVIPGT